MSDMDDLTNDAIIDLLLEAEEHPALLSSVEAEAAEQLEAEERSHHMAIRLLGDDLQNAVAARDVLAAATLGLAKCTSARMSKEGTDQWMDHVADPTAPVELVKSRTLRGYPPSRASVVTQIGGQFVDVPAEIVAVLHHRYDVLNMLAGTDVSSPTQIAAAALSIHNPGAVAVLQRFSNYREALRMTAHVAAETDNVSVLRLLATQDWFSVNWYYEPSGGTFLHLAATAGHHRVVRELLSSGANASEKLDNTCRSPLHRAVLGGHVECVRALVGCEHTFESRSNESTWDNMVRDACLVGVPEIVELLMERILALGKGTKNY